MGDLLKETKLLIEGLNLNPLEENGQNFLVDESILETEINNARISRGDTVLDIGAGFGYAIREMAKTCKVVGVEKDVRIFSYLLNKYELDENVELINADFLKIIPPSFTKVVSNPPYPIVDRILNKLLKYEFVSGVMILPKTVSDSLCELPSGKRTKFSTVQRAFFDFNTVMEVPKEAFYPQPRVTSTMVSLVRKPRDFLQETLNKEEMTVKNALLRTYQGFEGRTKRGSREVLGPSEGDIGAIADKEVKKLTLAELDVLSAYVRGKR